MKWLLAFLVGLLTGGIATLINLAVENIAGYKLLAVVKYIDEGRYYSSLYLIFFLFERILDHCCVRKLCDVEQKTFTFADI